MHPHLSWARLWKEGGSSRAEPASASSTQCRTNSDFVVLRRLASCSNRAAKPSGSFIVIVTIHRLEERKTAALQTVEIANGVSFLTGGNGVNREEAPPLFALFPSVQDPEGLVAAKGRQGLHGNTPVANGQYRQASRLDGHFRPISAARSGVHCSANSQNAASAAFSFNGKPKASAGGRHSRLRLAVKRRWLRPQLPRRPLPRTMRAAAMPSKNLTRDQIAAWYFEQLPFQPYPVQKKRCWPGSPASRACWSAPTGTGKTLIAEAAIFEALQTGKRAYYTTPLIALTDQKFNEFQKLATQWGFYPEDVGLVTGNRRVNPDAPVLVVVAEILLNRLLTTDFPFDDVIAVVMDEFHNFNDFERGIVWELPSACCPNTSACCCCPPRSATRWSSSTGWTTSTIGGWN